MLTDKQRSDIFLKIEELDLTVSKVSRIIRCSNTSVRAVIYDGDNNHNVEYRLVLWSQDKLRFTENGKIDFEFINSRS